MKLSSPLLRAAVVSACAAALAVVPSVSAVGARVHAAAAPKPAHSSEIPSSNTELRAPAPPPTTHPTEPRGYVSPSAAPGLHRAAVVAAATPASARTWGNTTSATSTLIVYDTTNTFGWLGELYAIAAGNLASHFGSVTAEPVIDYQLGQVNSYTATIYLGSTFNEPIPVNFLNDVRATTHHVMWVGDNVWQLSGTGTAETAFQTTYGWDATNSFFDDVDAVTQVSYNGQVLTRNADSGMIIAPDITSTTGQVTVLASAQCGTIAAPVACAPIAQTAVGATTFPWAIKSANLTYVGEIPLSFISETDRYLAFSDQMFDLLAPAAPVVHQALVRLEDVSPGLDTPAQLMADADYLSSVHVPFSVGVIPIYTDPLGFNGTPVTENIGQTSNPTIAAFDAALRYMVSKGGTIIEHGYTHQYSNVRNPYSASSGDDFEFYRSQCATTQNPPYTFDDACVDADWIIQEGPLSGDSSTYAQTRAAAGKTLFPKAGFTAPTIWETPHYSASSADYHGFNTVFPTRYEREQFFGGELTGVPNATRVFGQFYPYVVHDVYGTTVIPEDLGNFEPLEANHTPARPPATIIANAQAELAVRQGVASFFFHPYYDVADLQQIVAGIQGLGYTFVSPSTILQPLPTLPSIVPGSGSVLEGNSGTTTLNVPVTLSSPSTQTVTAQWKTVVVTGTANQADPATDYVPATGTVTFTPGQTAQTVPITVKGDTLVEPNETIIVQFGSPTNATIGGIFGLGTGTITNDDKTTIVPGSASVLEGNSGTTTLNLPVALTNPSTLTVTAQWKTVVVTGTGSQADPATDYVPATGTVTFTPGQTTQTVPITVKGDTLVEPDETIIVQFGSPTNATMGGIFGLGFGTITNDDHATIVPGSGSVLEGNSGTTTLNVPVTLTNPSTQTITVQWKTVVVPGAANQADPATDYVAASGTLTFTPGQTTLNVSITVNGDTLVEPNESIIVQFGNATNAAIGGIFGLGFGTITNDD